MIPYPASLDTPEAAARGWPSLARVQMVQGPFEPIAEDEMFRTVRDRLRAQLWAQYQDALRIANRIPEREEGLAYTPFKISADMPTVPIDGETPGMIGIERE